MSQFRILDYNYLFDESVDVTATSEDTSFPLTNLRHFHLSKVNRSTSATAQRWVFDLKTPEDIDSFVVFFDKQAGIKLSSLATIRLEGHPANTWGSPLVSVTPTIDDINHCISYFFTTAQNCRFWSLYIDEPSNAWGYVELGKVWLTKGTQLSSMPEIGFIPSVKDLSDIQTNEYGVEFSDTFPSRRARDYKFHLLNEDDRQLVEEIYSRCGRVKPVVLALDPLQAFFDDKDDHTIYGYLDNEFAMPQIFNDFYDLAIRVREAL